MDRKVRNIYVVGNELKFANWMEGEIVGKMEDANLVVFTGGVDISPNLYNDKKHPNTWCSMVRDRAEIKEFKKALLLQIPIIGICRGAQLLCILAGGKLIQDQSNENSTHAIELYDGKTLMVNSLHHQAQYPYTLPEEEYLLIGWSKNQSAYHKNGYDDEMDLMDGKEVEIAYYRKINGLAIQPHVEIMIKNYDNESYCKETIDYLRILLNDFLTNKL